MRKRLIGALMLAVACALFLFAVPAHAERQLGGVDVMKYCSRMLHSLFGSNVSHINAAPRDPHNAYTWRCTWLGDSQGVNMNSACSLQYGPGAWAKPLDARNAYSWRCFR